MGVVRTDIPHSARIYDYLLGGKDNFQADRRAAANIVEVSPHLPISMRANRHYVVRVARHLATDLGFRQFLDVGTGLPIAPNLHEVAQGVAPESRIVYVDNDPIVLVHARALLGGTPQGRIAYVDADLRDPESILAAPGTAILDLSRPVALCLIAIIQFVTSDEQLHGIITRLMSALPTGSALALSTVTTDSAPEEAGRGVDAYRAQGIPVRSRSRAEVERLFDGLELIDPGVTLVSRWRPDPTAAAIPSEHVWMYGGVAIKRS